MVTNEYIENLWGEISREFFEFPFERFTNRPFWLGHIPFARWIVRALKPKVLVELGAETGVSYCAFCEVVKRSSLNTKCYAVDTWKGDAHSGQYGDKVYFDLKDFHDQRYLSFSSMIRKSFDEALADFEDGSIDLLHIDGFHTYEAAKHDFETWLPKVSQRGVILIHDINIRSGDFGVWRLWEEIGERFPTFHFNHSNGLGVVGVGSQLPQEMSRFLSAEHENTEEAHHIRKMFEWLGDVLGDRYKNVSVRLWQNTSETGIHDAVIDFGDKAIIMAKNAELELHVARSKAEQLQVRVARLETCLSDKNEEVARLEERRKYLATEVDKIKESTLKDWQKSCAQLGCMYATRRDSCFSNFTLMTGIKSLAAFFRYRLSQIAPHLLSPILKVIQAREFQSVMAGKLSLRATEVFIHQSGLFDDSFYLENNPDVFATGMDPLSHFIRHGASEGRDPNSLFDCSFYLEQYPDVRSSGVNPLEHYLRNGALEGRDPHPLFDTSYYVEKYPQVKEQGANPLVHYLKIGAEKLFSPHPLIDPSFVARQLAA